MKVIPRTQVIHSDTITGAQPVSWLKSYGDSAFSVASPTLPVGIKNASSLENFKSVLKTHLFEAFCQFQFHSIPFSEFHLKFINSIPTPKFSIRIPFFFRLFAEYIF